MLIDYEWPGNVRELKNIIERIMVLNSKDTIEFYDIPEEIRLCNTQNDNVSFLVDSEGKLKDATKTFERDYIIKIMKKNNWNVAKAAEEMCIARKNLYRKLNDYNIKYK